MSSKPVPTLSDFFGVTYLINLPERVDRLRAASEELARVGWSVAPAGVSVFPARRFDCAAGFQSIGERGCFSSHMECLRLALQEKRGDALLLEDDITFSSSLPRLTPAIIEQLRSTDWDFVYFGHEMTGPIPRATHATTPRELRLVEYHEGVLTAHFYGVRSRIQARFLEHLENLLRRPPGDPEGGPMSFDGAISFFRKRNAGVRTLIAVPKLGWQRPSRSDLAPNRIDAVRILRPVLALGRGLMHRIRRVGS
jgi:Glycosyltransferase family 25 (LPS biosynthesis protein)